MSWSLVPTLSLGPDCTTVTAPIQVMSGSWADQSTRVPVKVWLGLRITGQSTYTANILQAHDRCPAGLEIQNKTGYIWSLLYKMLKIFCLILDDV